MLPTLNLVPFTPPIVPRLSFGGGGGINYQLYCYSIACMKLSYGHRREILEEVCVEIRGVGVTESAVESSEISSAVSMCVPEAIYTHGGRGTCGMLSYERNLLQWR